jgi:hypothetical protein
MPKIGVDAREALRSLSERGSLERTPIRKLEPAEEPATPFTSESPIRERTVSEILQAAKPAETSPLPGETKPVERTAPEQEKAQPVSAEQQQQQQQRPVEIRQNKKEASKSGRHAKAARLAKSATPAAEPVPAAATKPAAEEKPVQTEKAQPEKKDTSRSGGPAFEAPLLGMGPNPNQSFWANIPMVVKAGVAVLVLGIATSVVFKFSGSPNGSKRAGTSQQAKANLTAVPMSGMGGWTANWGDPAKMQGRAVSLFRPSLQHADYRIEFDAQIEAKAFGWVFRAKDPQNYHAYKIETVKPGLQPLVALARISVIAGVESQKHYTLIESPVRPDTVFRVRMDAIGSEFTTRINDQLIEVWQDDRLRFGGVGLFSDPGERAQIRKVQIFEMR